MGGNWGRYDSVGQGINYMCVFVQIYSLGLALQNCLFCSLGASVYFDADNILNLLQTRGPLSLGRPGLPWHDNCLLT